MIEKHHFKILQTLKNSCEEHFCGMTVLCQLSGFEGNGRIPKIGFQKQNFNI